MQKTFENRLYLKNNKPQLNRKDLVVALAFDRIGIILNILITIAIARSPEAFMQLLIETFCAAESLLCNNQFLN